MANESQAAGPQNVYEIDKAAVPEAIVIHCSDPRFQGAFERFLREELHLEQGQYIPIVVGGGAGVLAHPERLPKEFRFLRQRLEHYRGSVFPTARRLVLINHEGCRYYQGLKARALGYRVLRERATGGAVVRPSSGQTTFTPEGGEDVGCVKQRRNPRHQVPSGDPGPHAPPPLPGHGHGSFAQAALNAEEHEDLAAIAPIFARLLPHLDLKLEPYFARFTDEAAGKVVFEKVGV